MTPPLNTAPLTRRSAATRLLAAGAAATFASLPLGAYAQGGKALRKVRVQDMPKRWNGYELLFLAQKKGLFEEFGLQVELVPLPIDQYTMAVDSGVVDFALSADYIYFANIRAKGLKMKEVVCSNHLIDPAGAGDGLFVLAGSPIKTAKDLRGKKIGMRSVGFSSAWFTQDFLGRNGVKKGEAQFLTIPDLQLEQVLQTGAVDAVFAYGPIDGQLRKRGLYRQVFQISDLAGRRIQRGGAIAREAFIAQNPDIVRGFVSALGKAGNHANRNPKEIVDLGVSLGRLDPAVAPLLYAKFDNGDFSALRFAEDGVIDPKDVQFWLDAAERHEVVPVGQLKVADLYTNEFNASVKG